MATEPTFWIEAARTLPSIVTAMTAIVGVVIAARGLNRWRLETIGKRRAELAEDVLADFYEARDIVQSARSPLSSGSEGSSRKRMDGETEDQARTWDAYYAIAERLANKSEFFAKLNARRYRFRAYFGLEATKPYEEVRGVHNEIMTAVQMLIMTSRRGEDSAPSNLVEKWQSIIWWGSAEEDEIAKRMEAAIVQIETTCRPIIQEGIKRLK